MSVPLPTSDKAPYNVNYWPEITEKLSKLQENPSEDLLEKIILRFLNETKLNRNKYIASCAEADEIPDHTDLKTLRWMLATEQDILSTVIPFVCQLALELPTLFPSKELKILKKSEDGEVTLSRRQIACLVAHMFFCTILPASGMSRQGYIGQFVGDASPTGPITFRYWHTSFHNPTKLYQQSLMNYFRDLTKSNLTRLETQFIVFKRKCLQDEISWEQSNKQIIKISPDLKGLIGDIEGHIEMDFANENVGFGTTGTQEELILGTSLESTPVVLFNETLMDRDALLIQGIKKYGNFKGYAFSVKYAGIPEDDRDWSERKILAMDAYCYIGDEKVQLQSEHMKREVNKAYCAFSMVSSAIVDTGHWGCGAFGGNKGLKALLQVMAASEANLQELVFCSFGDEEFNENFQQVVIIVEKKKLTVGDLWRELKNYEKSLKSVDQSGIGCLKYIQKVLK